MTALAAWRAEAAALIPRGFLRRAQAEAWLFASDYPRRCERPDAVTDALAAAGFVVSVAGSVAYLDAAPARYRALLRSLPAAAPPPPSEETLPLHALALRLCRARTPAERQPIPPLRLTLKLLDAGETDRLLLLLPPRLALLQRSGAPLPSGAGELIFAALADMRMREETPC